MLLQVHCGFSKLLTSLDQKVGEQEKKEVWIHLLMLLNLFHVIECLGSNNICTVLWGQQSRHLVAGGDGPGALPASPLE